MCVCECDIFDTPCTAGEDEITFDPDEIIENIEQVYMYMYMYYYTYMYM